MEQNPSPSYRERDGGPPLRLVLSEDRTSLTVAWPGAAPRRLSAGFLRSHSRASGALRARLDGHDTAIDDTLSILAIELVGSYAVNLAFSDGHDRGIYPWAYLRAIAAVAEPPIEGKELLTTPTRARHGDCPAPGARPSATE